YLRLNSSLRRFIYKCCYAIITMQYRDLVSIGDVSVSPESKQIYFGTQEVRDSDMGGVIVSQPYILGFDTLLEFEKSKRGGLGKYLPHKLVEKDNHVSKSVFGGVEIKRVDEFNKMFKKSSSLSSSEYRKLLDVVEFIDTGYEGLVVVRSKEEDILKCVKNNQTLTTDERSILKKLRVYNGGYFMVRDDDRFVLTQATYESIKLHDLVCDDAVRNTVFTADIFPEKTTLQYLNGVIENKVPIIPHAHLDKEIDGISHLDFNK
ncbi:MAG: hypothetical protein KAS12_03800, partial [Candidatus Aenigmarchaeota archaeon]|nr:hypothetical protein [Candidatus Aenigmarchaeota archaeon]